MTARRAGGGTVLPPAPTGDQHTHTQEGKPVESLKFEGNDDARKQSWAEVAALMGRLFEAGQVVEFRCIRGREVVHRWVNTETLSDLHAELMALNAAHDLPVPVQPSVQRAYRQSGFAADHLNAALLVLQSMQAQGQ